jgi:hypothetical protein
LKPVNITGYVRLPHFKQLLGHGLFNIILTYLRAGAPRGTAQGSPAARRPPLRGSRDTGSAPERRRPQRPTPTRPRGSSAAGWCWWGAPPGAAARPHCWTPPPNLRAAREASRSARPPWCGLVGDADRTAGRRDASALATGTGSSSARTVSFPTHTHAPLSTATKLRAGRPRNQGSFPGNARFVSPPQSPDQLWGPPTFPANGFRKLHPCG